MLLAVDQIAGIEGSDFEPMAVGNGVRRAGLYAIAAKNAAVVIDVVNLRVPLRARNPRLRRIFRGLNINAVGRARRRAQKARDAFFQAIFIAL